MAGLGRGTQMWAGLLFQAVTGSGLLLDPTWGSLWLERRVQPEAQL